MRRLGWISVVLALFASVLVSSTASAKKNPAQGDSFYTPPSGYERTDPGTVLRSRPVKLVAFGVLPQRVQAWQLLYRSTDANGEPMATVTTVLKPAGGKARGLLSYQIAEDASAPQCAPSHTLRAGNIGEVINQAEVLLIDSAVAQGFAVSVPDYEGPKAEFGAARQPGHAILDGIRATQRFGELGLPGRATPSALWGYSGGSLASGWGAEMQPSYAPELNLRGAAVGGFATNLEQAVRQINGGLISSALPGILRAEPELAAQVERYINDKGRAVLAKASTQCEIPNVTGYPFANLNDYLTIPMDEFLAKPEVKRVLDGLNLGRRTPTTPMYVYHATGDELIPIKGADATVRQYCAAGTSVNYTRELLGEHGSAAVTGAGGALEWLSQRVMGDTTPKGCTTKTVPTSVLTPPGLSGTAKVVLGSLRGLLNRPLGPESVF